MSSNLRLIQAPTQRLIMTLALRQAIEVLQMPQLELAQWLRGEIEKNPLLEEVPPLSAAPLPKHASEEIASPCSLYEYLTRQIQESPLTGAQRRIADSLLHHLDEKGFLAASLEDLSNHLSLPKEEIEEVLSFLQTLDPPGIFARTLQETLLLQLKAIGEVSSPSYSLVDAHFEDLLKGRFQSIEKHLGRENLSLAVQKLSRLSFRPASRFRDETVPLAIPDLRILKVDRKWMIEVAEEELPKIELSSDYSTLTPESTEERESLRQWTLAAKWLFRSLKRRRQILLAVSVLLVQKQAPFLEQKGELAPLTLQELSHHLQLHESTLSRALAGKYASTPRGLLPIRSLITSSPTTSTMKEALCRLIAEEDKKQPLTDEELSQELGKMGHKTARRTVAKYRKELKLGSASARRYFN